jgi:hypothetical protein
MPADLESVRAFAQMVGIVNRPTCQPQHFPFEFAEHAKFVRGNPLRAVRHPVSHARLFAEQTVGWLRQPRLWACQASGHSSPRDLPFSTGKETWRWAGAGRQGRRGPIEVAAGKVSSIDLSLTVDRAPALPPAWPGRSPGERGEEAAAAVGGGVPRLAEGEGKAIIEAKCMTCHDAQRIVRSRANEARWQ